MGSLYTDADGVGLGRNTSIADVDVITTRGQGLPAAMPKAMLLIAGGEAIERANTVRRIIVAGRVVKERTSTGGRVVAAGCVA